LTPGGETLRREKTDHQHAVEGIAPEGQECFSTKSNNKNGKKYSELAQSSIRERERAGRKRGGGGSKKRPILGGVRPRGVHRGEFCGGGRRGGKVEFSSRIISIGRTGEKNQPKIVQTTNTPHRLGVMEGKAIVWIGMIERKAVRNPPAFAVLKGGRRGEKPFIGQLVED